MSNYRIAVLVGSLRKDSFNHKLALSLAKLAPSNYQFEVVRIDDLPLYNQDDDGNPAPQVQRLRDHIKSAQGVLFVTPEYNRSIPGVLKNAIDQASRPWGQSVWAGKPAAVVGITVGTVGTAVAQQHLRNVLAFLDMPTLAQPEVFLQAKEGLFKEGGDIGIDETRQFLQKWVDRYTAWVAKHA